MASPSMSLTCFTALIVIHLVDCLLNFNSYYSLHKGLTPATNFYQDKIQRLPIWEKKLLKIAMASDNDIGEENYVDAEEDKYDYLKEQFQNLCKADSTIDINKFIRWDEIQQLMKDDLITKVEIRDLWNKHASASNTVDVNQFIALNDDLDVYLEERNDNDEDDDYAEDEEASGDARIPLEDVFSSINENIKDMSKNIEPSVWFPGIDSKTLFEPEFLEYLTRSFDSLAVDGKLTLESFSKWQDVQQLMEDGNLDKEILRTVWKEAVEYQYSQNDLKNEESHLDLTIDLDTFYRTSYRLDDMMDEFQEALKNLSERDVEEFYRSEFTMLTGGGKYLSYDAIIRWPFLKETFESNPDTFTMDEFQTIWNAIPKKVNDNGDKVIDEEAFLVLNEAIDDVVMSFEINSGIDLMDDNILQ